jgi:hypothetical protein
MVSRENAVILLFVAVGLGLAYAGLTLTSLSDTVLIGVLILVGVVAPQLLNGYLDSRDVG